MPLSRDHRYSVISLRSLDSNKYDGRDTENIARNICRNPPVKYTCNDQLPFLVSLVCFGTQPISGVASTNSSTRSGHATSVSRFVRPRVRVVWKFVEDGARALLRHRRRMEARCLCVLAPIKDTVVRILWSRREKVSCAGEETKTHAGVTTWP